MIENKDHKQGNGANGAYGPMGLKRLMRLMVLMGLVVLMGCSGEHVVAPQESEPQPQPQEEDGPVAISFANDLSEETAVTRANLEDVHNNFKVWAYKNMSYDNSNEEYGSTQTVMPGYTVNWVANTAYTTTSNTHDWEYVGLGTDQTIKYWDFGAQAYRFFAVAPATADTEFSDATNTYSFTFPVDVSSDAAIEATPYYSHLWFSNNTGDKLFGNQVTLEFTKPMAKVRFMITYPPLADGVSAPVVENYEFRPLNEDTRIALKGKITIFYPKDRAQTSEWWQNVMIDPSVNLLSMTTPNTWQAVLPVLGPVESGGQGAYVLKVVVNGEDRSCTVPEHYMTWKPGFQYTYVFKVDAQGGLKLDNVWVGVTEMGKEDEQDYRLYNW